MTREKHRNRPARCWDLSDITRYCTYCMNVASHQYPETLCDEHYYASVTEQP